MKYDEIEKLIKKYGQDYLGDNTIQKLLNSASYSESIRKELEEQVTEKWVNQAKKLGKILIYTDHFTRRQVPEEIIEKKGGVNIFPFVRCSYQDKIETKTESEEIDIPNIKYIEERVLHKDYDYLLYSSFLEEKEK